MLVQEGQTVPGANGVFSILDTRPSICEGPLQPDPTVVFHAYLQETTGVDDDAALFKCSIADGEVPEEIVRRGQSPPEGNGQYDIFNTEVSQSADAVAFLATMRNSSNPALDRWGIYRARDEEITKIARTDEPVPGGNGVLRTLYQPVINPAGQVAFQAWLRDTTGGFDDDVALYVSNGLGLVEVARKGDPLLGSIITQLHFATGPAGRNGLNEYCQVAYKAVLADGREALALATPLVEWTGGATGDWPDSSNWTLGIQPAAVHDVAITPVGSVGVTGPRVDTTVKSLTLGSAGGGSAVLNLTGVGDLAVVGTFALTADGAVLIGAGRTLSTGALVNEGTLSFAPGVGNVSGQVVNRPGGTILVPGGADARLQGRVDNAGAIDVAVGASLQLPEFAGHGCTGAGTVRLTGPVRPGPGIWTMAFEGDVIFTPQAVLHLELRGQTPGLEHDRLSVAGEMALGGNLSVELLHGFVPMPGEAFEILAGGARMGSFKSTTGLAAVGGLEGLRFELTYATDGATLTATATPGDATLDGAVNVFDLAALGNNYQTGPDKDWMDADFTGDGEVTILDLAHLANNYTGTAGGTPIPEPAAMSALVLGALGALRRRRRQREADAPRSRA